MVVGGVCGLAALVLIIVGASGCTVAVAFGRNLLEVRDAPATCWWAEWVVAAARAPGHETVLADVRSEVVGMEDARVCMVIVEVCLRIWVVSVGTAAERAIAGARSGGRAPAYAVVPIHVVCFRSGAGIWGALVAYGVFAWPVGVMCARTACWLLAYWALVWGQFGCGLAARASRLLGC